MVEATGVTNLELVAADISQVEFNIDFDYIICHGVFSWVPEAVREAILTTIQQYLTPNGIAFISYNTFPGWKSKNIIKNLMKLGTIGWQGDKLSQLERALDFTEQTGRVIKRNSWHLLSKTFDDIYNPIVSAQKSYLAHEYLETYNFPLYFMDIIKILRGLINYTAIYFSMRAVDIQPMGDRPYVAREAIEIEALIFSREQQPRSSSDIDDEEIVVWLNAALENLELKGYFNPLPQGSFVHSCSK